MRKRLAILVALAVMMVTVAGCRPSPPTPWDDTVERQNLTVVVNDWTRGIEEYDIDAMAGNVLAAGFKLTIEEAGRGYEKDETQLIAELRADEDDQLEFRFIDNYILELRYEWSIVELTPSVAKVAGNFTVFESSDSVPRWKSDTGQIVIEFEKGSEWKMTAMAIEFDCLAKKSIGSAMGLRRGFGF